MKKVLVVLLIAVLAMSAVFAEVSSFTGSLTTKLTYDIDKKSFTLRQTPEITGKFAFSLFDGNAATASAKGEGYPYAEIEGALAIDFEDFEFAFGNVGTTRYSVNKFWDSPHAAGEKDEMKDHVTTDGWFSAYDMNSIRWSWSGKLSDIITRAAIVGENWELDLLKNFGVGNFAHNVVDDTYKYEASNKVSKSVAYDFDNSSSDGDGVTFKYDQFQVGVNQFTFKNGEDDFELSFGSQDYEVTEAVTLSGAVNFKASSEDGNTLNTSAKAVYEDEKVGASVATDIGFGLAGTETKFDVAAGIDYLDGGVKGDFYYASYAEANNPYNTLAKYNKAIYKLAYDYTVADATYTVKYINDGDTAKTWDGTTHTVEKLMSAKASFDVAKLASLGEVTSLSAVLDGHDLLKENELNAYNVEVNATMDNYGVAAKAGAKDFTNADSVRVYAEVSNDFAKIAKLPVNSLTLTVGSESIVKDLPKDRLYFKLESAINEAVAVEVYGNKLIGGNRTTKLGAGVDYTGVENLVVGVDASHEFAGTKKTTVLAAQTTYDAELYDVTARLEANFFGNGDKAKVGAYLSATSDQIVHGADLSLTYGALTSKKDAVDFGKVDWNNNKLNALTASCKITF